MSTSFFVPGRPRPQPRPRVYAKHTVSDSPESLTWKNAVAWAFSETGAACIAEGPVGLAVGLVLPRPKRLMRKKDPAGVVPCDRRPDLDNYAKAVMDALSGLAFTDDGQVAILTMSKRYGCKAGGDVGAHIIVEERP